MYISIEKLIEQTKETYYETLQESSYNWHEEENDDAPFVRYMLGVIVAAYRDFSSRVQLLAISGMSKPERIREIVRGSIGKMTRAQIMEKCPDISRVTVERALTDMVKKGEILKSEAVVILPIYGTGRMNRMITGELKNKLMAYGKYFGLEALLIRWM